MVSINIELLLLFVHLHSVDGTKVCRTGPS